MSVAVAYENSSVITGKVKWFNNKAGFGFITVCDGDYSGKDIFVHYSSIQVNNSQYKYLVQGEYVDFSLVKPTNSEHEFHAVNVGGVKGGSLMCETRRQNYVARSARPAQETRKDLSREVSREVETQAYSRREKETDGGDGFHTVSRKRTPKSAKTVVGGNTER